MLLRELSDFDGEWQVARAQDVDDAVVEEPCVEAQLLKEASKLTSCHPSLKLVKQDSFKPDITWGSKYWTSRVFEWLTCLLIVE